MLKIQGTLLVTARQGRRGQFHAGKLRTSIGEFDVDIDYRNNALEQFEPGSYDGDFLVTSLFLKTIRFGSGSWSVMAASIAPEGYLIDTQELQESSQTTVAAPPLDPTVKPGDVDSESESDSIASTPAVISPAVSVASAPEQDNKDESLFGVELFQLFVTGAEIALDPTVDREQFRHQRDRLKEAGYRFHAQSQVWQMQA